MRLLSKHCTEAHVFYRHTLQQPISQMKMKRNVLGRVREVEDVQCDYTSLVARIVGTTLHEYSGNFVAFCMFDFS
jgi:hypothetical protein